MKVIAINGSARKDGNTSIIIKTVLEELEKEGIQTEQVQLWDKPIKGCTGCLGCFKEKKCVFKDDYFNECFQKISEADGIILGSPVYNANITASMKGFMERIGMMGHVNSHTLRHKVGASVVAVRRQGGLATLDTLNHLLISNEVIIVGSIDWNMVFGRDIGDVLNDEEGMKNMQNLGQNMASVMKKLSI